MFTLARNAVPLWGLVAALSFTGVGAWAQSQLPSQSERVKGRAGDPVASTSAQPLPESSDPLPESIGGMGAVLARTALVLALIVALIYLTLNVGLRRLMGVRALPAGRKPVVTVLERVPLSQKHSLFVVQAAGDYLLLGSGESGVSLVSRLNADAMEQPLPKSESSTTPFLEKLLSKREPS